MPRYLFIPDRSRMWITARSTLHEIHSTATGVEGYVELLMDGDGVDLSVPPEGKLSVEVARLSSGNRFEDHEMHRRADARRFPTIDAMVTDIESLGEDGTYQVTGDVAFRGVLRSYKDEMRVRRIGERTIGLEGRSTIDVRDFGMEPPRFFFVAVEPVVEVRVALEAELDEEG